MEFQKQAPSDQGDPHPWPVAVEIWVWRCAYVWYSYQHAAQALAIGYVDYGRFGTCKYNPPNAFAGRVAVSMCPFSNNRGYAPASRGFVAR